MTVPTVRWLWLWIGLLPALAATAGAEAPGPVPVVVHEDHFLRNDSGLNQPAHFLVIGNSARFDAVFGTVPPLMNQRKRNPVLPGAFQTHRVVAAVHQGREYTDYRDVKATLAGTTLTLAYRTAVRATPQTVYACPLIVTVPRGPLTQVVFVENGKPVAEVKVADEEAQDARAKGAEPTP